MRNRAFSVLKYLLGWPFSILAFIFILRLIAPKVPEFLIRIHQLNASLLLFGIIFFLFFYAIRSYIWHRLLKQFTNKIAYKQSAYFWAISELKRYVPGSIWSFLGRTFAFSELGVGKKDITKLIIVEAGLLVLGSLVISLLSLPFIVLHFLPGLTLTYQSLIYLTTLLLVLIYIFNRKIIEILPDFGANENSLLLLLSSCAVFAFGIANYLVISSIVNLPLDLLLKLSGFFVLSLLLGYLSLLTPAGFGVREGIVIAGLSKFVTVQTSAFAALFSRIILICSELIFILLTFLWHKNTSKRLSLVENWISTHKQETVLAIFGISFTVYFSIVTFLRFDNFYTGKFDLGNMVQTVWNTTQGRIFEFSNPNATENISRLAFHADFLLILLAPIYAIFSTPKTLLFIQVAVLALGSAFVYLIAKDKLNNKNLALAFGFAYLINPSIQRTILYDFHPVTLATTFLLGTYYFYDKKKYIWFMVFAMLAAISKEQIWVIIALFGGLIFIKHKKWVFGSAIFFSSLAMFYYLVSIAIPGAHGADHFALSYFSEFGDSPINIIKSIILSPDKIIALVLEKDRFNYLVQLFRPLGYLSFLAPWYLIFAGPDLLINVLSNNAQLHQIYYQYTAAITPFILISSIFGVMNIFRFFPKKFVSVAVVYILAASLIGAYRYGPLPGSKDPNTDMFVKPVQNKKFIDEQLSRIPSNLSVASSNNVGSHLSERENIYILPLGVEKADVLVFLLNNSEQPDSLKVENKQLKTLKNDKRYVIVSEKEDFTMFRKKDIKL